VIITRKLDMELFNSVGMALVLGKGIMLLSVGGTIFLKHGARRMGVFFIA